MIERARGHSWLFWLVAGLAGLLVIVLVLGALNDNADFDPAGGANINEPVEPLPPDSPNGGGDTAALTSCSGSQSISWADATDNLNVKVALVGPVSDVEPGAQGRELLTVGSGDDAEPVTLVLTQNLLEGLGESADRKYADSTVCAIGVLERVEGRLQMVVNTPRDLATF